MHVILPRGTVVFEILPREPLVDGMVLEYSTLVLEPGSFLESFTPLAHTMRPTQYKHKLLQSARPQQNHSVASGLLGS
mgnify:FL=1